MAHLCNSASCNTTSAQQNEIIRKNAKLIEVITILVMLEKITHTHYNLRRKTEFAQLEVNDNPKTQDLREDEE